MNSEQTQFQERLKEIYKSDDEIEPLVGGLEGVIPPKSMSEYYIKLQILIDQNKEKKDAGYEKISGNKQEVEVKNIFEKLPGQEATEGSEINKLLILGGAGVGKSTLMRYIAYEWGRGDLWNDKFDFVYRVPLKTLLNNDWKDHNHDDLNRHQLKRLVHYHLASIMKTKERKECKLGNIVWFDEKNPNLNDKILLLLDGYDEVAHLKNESFKIIFEEIFEFKNIIFTSRPNAMTREVAEKFDRTIENSGLGSEGIDLYFSLYFKKSEEKGKRLRDFLAKNPSIREICNIPVNIAMLCFIWNESKSKKILQKISNMSDLYGQVVDHLGFRYYSKEHENSEKNMKTFKSLWKAGGIHLDELQILQHVAYRGLMGNALEAPNEPIPETLIIPGMIARGDTDGVSVQSSINYLRNKCADKQLTIESVYQYGLLKAEGLILSEDESHKHPKDESHKHPKDESHKHPKDEIHEHSEEDMLNHSNISDSDLQARNFSFIHLSFQEFLTAQYLVNQLKSSTDDQTRIADFIASHRNEPRYALILKFMAGIFRADVSKKDEKLNKATKIFWDAIVCNPNGALEFGIDAKVNLLMHLLSQAKDETGRIDERIPNRELMVKFIDFQMLENFIWRINELKESNYMSTSIKENLLEVVLDENFTRGSILKQELEKEFDSKFQINSEDVINEILIEEDSESEESSQAGQSPKSSSEMNVLRIDAFTSLLHHFSAKEQEKVVQKLLQDVENFHKQKEGELQVCQRKICALTKIFKVSKLNQDHSRTFIKMLLTTIFDQNFGDISVKGILETIKASDVSSFKDLVKEALRKCTLDANAKNLNSNLEAVTKLLEIVDFDQDTEIILRVLEFAVSKLSDPNVLIREASLGLIKSTLEKQSGAGKVELIQHHLKPLTDLLIKSDDSIKKAASEVICQLISSSETQACTQALWELFENLLSSPGYLPPSVGDPIFKSLSTHFISSNPQMMEKIIEMLFAELRSPKMKKTSIAPDMLCIIAKIYGKTNLKLIQEVITEFAIGLKISRDGFFQYLGFTKIIALAEAGHDTQIYAQSINAFTPFLYNSELIRERAVNKTAELLKASQDVDKSLFCETINSLVKVFQDPDSSKRNLASQSLMELAEKCKISDVELLKETVALIMPLIEESSEIQTREIAIRTILNLFEIKDSQDPSQNPVETAAADDRRCGQKSQLIEEVINIFTSKLSKASPQFRARIVCAIAELEMKGGNSNIEKLKEIIKELNALLEDPNNDIKQTSAEGIMKLLRVIKDADPQILRNTIKNFTNLLENVHGNLRAKLIFYITEISKIIEDKDIVVLNHIIPILVPYLQDSSFDLKRKQQDAIMGVARLMGNNTTPPKTQLAGDMIKTLFRIFRIRNLEKHVQGLIPNLAIGVVKTYKNSDNQTREEIIEMLISHVNIVTEKTVSSCLEELMSDKDPQLFEKIHNLLNLKFEKESNSIWQAPFADLQLSILELRTKIEIMNDDGNIQRAQNLITILRPYLESKQENIKIGASNCLVDLFSKSAVLRDDILIQDIVKIQNSALKRHVGSNMPVLGSRKKLASLIGLTDKAFVRNRIFDVLVLLKENHGCRDNLDFLNELFKLYGNVDLEFMEEIMERVTPYFEGKNEELQYEPCGLFQSLGAHILPHEEVLRKYFDHHDRNVKQHFRSSVCNYFKTYLNRFEVLESIVSKNNLEELTLENIIEKLFDGLLPEAGSRKINSSLSELKTSNTNLEQQIDALKLLIANELDEAEIRKGIKLTQIAYISIERSEDGVEKELSDISWQVLNTLFKYFTKEKLQWISDNYSELAASAPSVHKIFCIKLYHRILANCVITPLEEKIITVFLQQGLTTSLTDRGEIIFQGVKYQIEGDEIRFMLERIARVIIKSGQDLLARQYKMKIPLFEKSFKAGGMQEAAVDRRKMPSLVDERFILRSDYWLLTSLKPLNANTELILLEQRSAFGHHVVIKLEGEKFTELSREFNLEDVFGKRRPGLIFIGKSKKLSPLKGQELVKNPWTTKFEDVEGGQVGQNSLYYQQELLGGGKEDQILRALACKQDKLLQVFEEQLLILNLEEPRKAKEDVLREYYVGFMATFVSVYAVSHVIDSGMFAIEIEAIDKLSPAGLFTTLVALIPFGIGKKLSGDIEKFIMAVKQNQVKNEAVFMKAFAFSEIELSDRVSKIALERILKEETRNEILEARDLDVSDPDNLIAKIQEYVTSKIQQWKNKATQVTGIDNLFAKEIQKIASFRLGESQANEIIQAWFAFNHDENNRNLLQIDKQTQFDQLVTTKNLLRLKAKKNNVALDGITEGKSGCCTGCKIF